MDITSSLPSSSPSFKEMSTISARHTRSYGKASTSTGASAALKGEFFGTGFSTNFTGKKLFQAIQSKYGETLANSVTRQLRIQSQSDKPINSYQVAKAVALVFDWTKERSTEINYAQVDKNGNATITSAQCRVTLTPLGCLKSLANHLGVFGVSSTDGNNKNVVNGWVEEMHIGSNAAPSAHFLRSGMLMPAGGKETEDSRKATALNRYQQILSAMIETTSAMMPHDFDPAANSETNPLKIEHAHIGLLSANDKKESAMAQDQLDFISTTVNGKPIQIDYVKPGTTDIMKIWVKPTVLYTNFSVQKPQKKGTAELASDSPDAVTEKTLDHYLNAEGPIAKKIEALHQNIDSAHSNDWQQTKEWKLLEEVRNLRQTRSQEGSSFYSYEFQAKYSLLLAQCGIPTHVYCKSGKDRTSRFSEMIKMWAANPQLKLNKMTSAVRNLIKAFSFSGNATVQRLNTGFAGNKQAKTYWRLIAGEKKDLTGGLSHLPSAASYMPWMSVKT